MSYRFQSIFPKVLKKGPQKPKVMVNIFMFVTCALFLLITGCGKQSEGFRLFEAWDEQNDPEAFDPKYERTLAKLPVSGKSEKKPWSDNYWPSYRGGIAARWREGGDGFNYKSPTKKELKKMSLKERSMLSPAEKFDAYLGHFHYPTVQWERSRTSPSQPAWEGLCHGWAAASMHHAEPMPLITKSAQNIEIPFAASDIKALITFFYGQHSYTKTQFLGMRCNIKIDGQGDPRAKDPECKDLNAGSFHVVLANELGLKKASFVGDVVRDQEVWNQPIYAFTTEVLEENLPPSETAAPGTVEEVTFKTKMDYVEELAPEWDSQLDQDLGALSTKEYQYRLELSATGAILGGEWLGYERPDFFWRQEKPEFYGRWQAVEDLLKRSLNQRVKPEDPDLSPEI